jgi:hypothetical protein
LKGQATGTTLPLKQNSVVSFCFSAAEPTESWLVKWICYINTLMKTEWRFSMVYTVITSFHCHENELLTSLTCSCVVSLPAMPVMLLATAFIPP